MKKLQNLTLVLLVCCWCFATFAENEIPSLKLRENLEGMLSAKPEELDLDSLKTMAQRNNNDIEVAFQNYIIAKKRVSIARAALNPLTTAQVLGVSLGLNYLWAPIALEAVLSIPTKIYNISTNKYLAKAALYNSHEAKLALNNELAHLYFDILSHEVVLKTIDEEIRVYLFHKEQIEKGPHSDYGINNIQISLLHLKMEKNDIYNLYLEEIAALKILLMLDPLSKLQLAQMNKEMKKSYLDHLDVQNLQNYAVVNSNFYKADLNLQHAAESNVKSVKWSILSFSGLSPSYRARVRVSKIDAMIAHDQRLSTELKVRSGALVNLNNLNSSLNIFENYNSTYRESINVMEDYYMRYSLGNAPLDSVIETSIAAIRDFRSKVVSQYACLAGLDDLSKAVHFNFVYNNDQDNAQEQIEKASLYDLSAKSFRIVKKSNSETSMILAVQSKRNNFIKNVTYRFDNNEYPVQISENDTKDFYSVFTKTDISENHFSGVATISLINGHELEIKFKF